MLKLRSGSLWDCQPLGPASEKRVNVDVIMVKCS